MKNLLTMLRTGAVLSLVLMLLCGAAYPLAIAAVGQVFLNHEANGSLVYLDGKAVGSSLIAQELTTEGYFVGRPTGSPLPAVDPTITVVAHERLQSLGTECAPVDLVTHSGSGVDPHITVAAAATQLHSVATASGIPDSELQAMVADSTTGRLLGVFGEEYVNVLELNMAITEYKRSHP